MSARQYGFALVDLTMATLIGGAVLGGMVTMSSTRMSMYQEHTTGITIVEARHALIAYAQIHRRLPCPANPRLPSTDPRAGQEGARRGGACEFGYHGALPWATLGVAELDAWGSRLTYRVATDFADGADQCGAKAQSDQIDCLRIGQHSASYTATANTLVVKEDRGTAAGGSEVIAHGLAAVVVSHGPNSLFAFSNSGQPRASAVAQAARYEAANADPRSVTFYSTPADHRFAPCHGSGTSTSNCAHDDMLSWVSRAEITTAMVKAGHR